MNDKLRPWAAGLRALIVRKLHAHGPMTTRELALSCQVSLEAIAPRLSELEELGAVFDSGRRVSPTSGRGRKLKVWTWERPGRNAAKLDACERSQLNEDCAVMRLLA